MAATPSAHQRTTTEDVEGPGALVASEARFRLLVESVKDYAIFLLDPRGLVSSWNTGAERIKGYSAGEILGKHFSIFYTPEDLATDKCARELEIARREGRYEEEGWRVKKDGGRFWANVVITALHAEDGTLVGFAKVTRDLTERVRLEHERAHTLAMEEAARRKDDFLAIMGHELRNPLASIVTAAHLIRLRGGRATEKEIDVIDRQARQMTRLVDDLLDASRALRDKVVLLPALTQVSDVLANAIELASPLLEQRRHVLSVDVPSHGLLVNVDLERMAQVFGNIFTNAAKYTPEGGKIRLRAVASEGRVVVSVEDTGQGIAPDLLGQVFDLFTQGPQGLERKHGGLGIGLSVAKKMVLAHGGEIDVESEGPGRGTRVTVRLPLASAAALGAAIDTRAPSPEKKRCHILLVDDNPDSVDVMRMLLEDLGHETTVALDGPTAVEACRRSKPNIVFLDIGLPGLNGYEVVAQVRQLPGWAKIPIIALSGYAREGDRARAFSAGFTDHLAKPVEIGKLESLIENAAPY